MLFTKRQLGVGVHHERVGKGLGKPAPGRRHVSRMIAAASAAVTVERVGTACTLPDSRSTWFWIMSQPAAIVGGPATQSTPIIPEAPADRTRTRSP